MEEESDFLTLAMNQVDIVKQELAAIKGVLGMVVWRILPDTQAPHEATERLIDAALMMDKCQESVTLIGKLINGSRGIFDPEDVDDDTL